MRKRKIISSLLSVMVAFALLLSAVAVLPVQAAGDDNETEVTYTFDDVFDAFDFDFYHSSNGGFTIQNGKLAVSGEEGEFKAVLRGEGQIYNSVSLDIYPEKNGTINAGVYIGASNAGHAVDKINALAILVQSDFEGWEDAGNRIDLILGEFPKWQELTRTTSETGNGNALFSNGEKQPLNLKVDIKGKELTITLSLISDPNTYVQTVYSYKGDYDLKNGTVGIRSMFDTCCFDNFKVAYNEENVSVPKAISLGTNSITEGQYVYYGAYENNAMKWRILDSAKTNTGETGIFLLSEYVLDKYKVWFNEDGTENQWTDSDAKKWCDSFESSNLDSGELDAILKVSKQEKAFENYGLSFGENSMKDEQVFFLSAEEVANYIGQNDQTDGIAATTVDGDAATWWLRTPDNVETNLVSAAWWSGQIVMREVGVDSYGARPAINLNSDEIMFVSAASEGKVSNDVGGNAMKEVSSQIPTEWKVTLRDDERKEFTAKLLSDENGVIEVEYANAKTGENEFVSALICDKNGNVLYYGNIAKNSKSGTAKVNIPSGLEGGTYTLKVFSEQCNGDDKTDYSSKFENFSFEVDTVNQNKDDVQNGKGNILTGDLQNSMLWVGALTISVCVLAGVVIYRKKIEKEG